MQHTNAHLNIFKNMQPEIIPSHNKTTPLRIFFSSFFSHALFIIKTHRGKDKNDASKSTKRAAYKIRYSFSI